MTTYKKVNYYISKTMRFIRFTSTIFLLFLFSTSVGQINYDPGDTLCVVALGGINLRVGPGTDFEKITRISNGAQVVIKSISDVRDSIEFKGFWVEVKTVDGANTGYAFDAFLSQYPVINDLNGGAELTEVLLAYCEASFQPTG
ncbi:MAG: SH3 domain-containing protein, partial [Bacteroidota bacterium]